MRIVAVFDAIISNNQILRTTVRQGTVLGFAWHPDDLDDTEIQQKHRAFVHGCPVAFVLRDDGRAEVVPVRNCKFDVSFSEQLPRAPSR